MHVCGRKAEYPDSLEVLFKIDFFLYVSYFMDITILI